MQERSYVKRINSRVFEIADNKCNEIKNCMYNSAKNFARLQNDLKVEVKLGSRMATKRSTSFSSDMHEQLENFRHDFITYLSALLDLKVMDIQIVNHYLDIINKAFRDSIEIYEQLVYNNEQKGEN